jgi:hypothetical protein
MSESIVSSSNNHTIKFYLHTIKFTPFSNIQDNSNDILIKLITFLNKERLENKAYLVDKNKNRQESDKRELFMNVAYRIPKTKKIRCSIALLRAGKNLMVKPLDTYELVPFNKASGSIAEVTNFFIDYSRSPAVMCVEYNHNGPRLSDIEYYFRNIAHDVLRLSKATTTTTFMDVPIDKTIEELHNVLNFEIKLKPQNIPQMDDDIKGYITEFANLGQKLKPNFIRIEAMFQTPGAKVKSVELNKGANTMMTALLDKFRKKPYHIDHFEEFELKYVNKEGEDATFNLMKGKKEISAEIEPDAHLTSKEWFEKIESDFDEFMKRFES